LLAVVQLECIEESICCIIGVPDNEEYKVDFADVPHFYKPHKIPEHCIVFVLATAIVKYNIKL
jgi:hypothetical protein